jgi:hypothetical protein
MATQTSIQTFIHKLEEGGWAKWIRRALVVAAVLYVVNLWMFRESGFKGLNHERAIEQAQIAREIARGHGFSTKMIRPAALWQFRQNTGKFPLETTPDTYHAPLNPFINSLFLKLTEKTWVMDQKDLLYLSDKVLAAVQLGFFLLAVLINYFTIWRLFDQRLATFAAMALLVCQRFWDFALSGLPQMLMLFLFSAAVYTLVRAIEARTAGKSTLRWAAATGVLFALLALSHALTLWIFAGALLFAFFYFTPRGRDAAIMLAIVGLIYGVWMVRNARVCGNPLGLGWYSGLFQIQGTEAMVMRSMDLKLDDVTPTLFRLKIQGQVLGQLGQLYEYLGFVLVAPVFFIALLHLFRRPETSAFRWAILLMWLSAVFGMAVFGVNNEAVAGGAASPLHSNDLHVLFIPLLTAYGFAFVLMMWSRLEMNIRLVRIAFMALIYFVTALPFIQQFIELLKPGTGRLQWPPYVPPYIAVLAKWTNENEIIASDMPWAVAWYADRKSLWLPRTVADFTALNDYQALGSHLVGLYLTPVTGNRAFISEIVKGEYKEWAPFIVRQVNVRDFPLRAVTPLPIDNECVFYSDRDRWTPREE